MREIDLSKFKIRTDLVNDIISNENLIDLVDEERVNDSGVIISRINLSRDVGSKIGKKEGIYTTLYYDDVTDRTNYNNVLKVFSSELRRLISLIGISFDKTCLVIGLGNDKSTPDSLGPKVVDNINVTRHIYSLVGSLEKGYRVVSSFSPGVMGTTGVETSDIILSLVETVKPDFMIIVDALASDSIDRVLKTIQLTNTGINPGSGVGNHRNELSSDIFGVPVIAIGIPTVVDAVTIVADTINYMMKHFSYSIKNKDNLVDRLIPSSVKNYLKGNNLNLNEEETKYFLGAFGSLSDFEKRALIFDVLTPIGHNLIVTPKEIDFVIFKLSNLLSEGINNSIHDIK